MCHRACSISREYKIEVIAPCGQVVMIHAAEIMRPVGLINSERLLKHARKFFRELGFSGYTWKVRIQETTYTSQDGSINSKSETKIFE